MKNKLLRNGVEMPEVGFGTWKAGETDGFAVLSEAIRAGYRHIDTASASSSVPRGSQGRAGTGPSSRAQSAVMGSVRSSPRLAENTEYGAWVWTTPPTSGRVR